MYDIGDIVPIDIEITDEDGVAADPNQLFFSYSDPDGLPAPGNEGNADTPFEYDVDEEIIQLSSGHYRFYQPATKAGTWIYRWWMLDADDLEQGASEGQFIVQTTQSGTTAYYISISHIRSRLSDAKLIQLTDFDAIGVVDEGKINDCIASACGIIDSYCSGRYTLPLTVSAQIRDSVLAIAIYKLHSLRQIAPEKVRLEYEDAIAYLKDVAAGRATLEQASITQSISAEVVTRDHDTDPEAFDDTRLEDYIG